jgi:sigma-B regulation protein RsbU (phosphoserine phosphatase)
MKKNYPAKTEFLYEVLSDIENYLESQGFSIKGRNKFRLIAEELIVNVINYAYDGKDGSITVNLNAKNNEIIMSIVDSGIKFNPLQKENPDTNATMNERNPGGLGIHMAKILSDEMYYEFRNGQNILTVHFKDN